MEKHHFIWCIILISSFLLLLQQSHSFPNSSRKLRSLLAHESEKYAVIFDAGSTGSRVHVFRFDNNSNLLPIGSEFELYLQVKPGLSSYASEPEEAALSIEPLLDQAEDAIPKELIPETPIKLGATAGLRLLNGDASEKILKAVRELIKNHSSFKYKPEWVNILEGTDEAIFFWGALNYLLGKVGKSYSETVGTVDLGGGSVQITYAISKETAEKEPKLSVGGKPYVQEKNLLGTTYHLYAHSYLNYGLFAARGRILEVSKNSSHPCILGGYVGTYTYNGANYNASAYPSGPSFLKCRAFVLKAIKVDAPCIHKNCTFNGVWSGSGGSGLDNLYVGSCFYDIASEVGIMSPTASSATVQPLDFLIAAEQFCKAKYNNVKSTFPLIREKDIPFICMDLVYEYSLLVDGLGIRPSKKITVVKDVKYKETLVGAAWPLGSALDAISSME